MVYFKTIKIFMIIQELLYEFKDKKDKVLKNYLKNYSIFEDYEFEQYSKKKRKKITEKFIKLSTKRYDELLKIKPEIQNNVVFVLKQMDSFVGNSKHFHTFMCEKGQIEDLARNEFSLWTEEKPRIEHYSYEFTSVDKVLGMEVFYTTSKINAVCAIFHELIFHGLTEESSEKRKSEIIESIQEGIQDVKEGNYLSAEEVFKELEDEIYESASDEEKEKILKDRAEKEKNKDRDNVYMQVATRYNHEKCIAIIQSYYLSKVSSGEFQL